MNKLYISIAALAILIAGAFYISHLRGNLKEVSDERDKFKVQAQTVSSYITSYEPKKQENDLNYERWMVEADKVQVSQDCAVPKSIRSYIDKL